LGADTLSGGTGAFARLSAHGVDEGTINAVALDRPTSPAYSRSAS